MSDREMIKECQNEDAIRLVFRYLNGRELHNAYLVCKSWWKIGKSVNKERNPSCVTIQRKKTEKNENVVPILKNIIRLVVIDPSFCMFTTNDVVTYDNSENCHCTLLPSNCFSIRLENLVLKSEMTFISSVIFPNTTNIQIYNFTFDCRFSPQIYYCPEIYDTYNSHFLKCINLKRHFDPFLQTEHASTSCLILWCKQSNFHVLTNLIKTLAEWYPKSQVAIWGGVSDNIIVCNKKMGIYKCRKNVDFALFFINGQHMEIKSLVLDKHCATAILMTEKFHVFSESIILKEHSIGFMYTSYLHLDDFYELGSFLFKQYFTSVELFHTVGKEPFGGTGFVELFKRMLKIHYNESTIHTALMVLTYN